MNFALWCSFLPKKWNFHEMFLKKRKLIKNSPFWLKAVSKSKMQESRPNLKFNFTACRTSTYPLGPFLKLGNGMVWLWSYFYTFLHCNRQFASQFSYHCNSLIFRHYVNCDTNCDTQMYCAGKWDVDQMIRTLTLLKQTQTRDNNTFDIESDCIRLCTGGKY